MQAATRPAAEPRPEPVRRAPQPPPVDVDRIVDAVHRRLVRRLAVEADRRAAR
ncbi:hypothetical protein ACQEVB_35760 [Pseudonocardia sp. CA-107938]|uniref:hypothetical protein n=1 Tax=Pseudonocardia sp. CA-107938 TaxID=3240021 RepID=UPI003D8E448A